MNRVSEITRSDILFYVTLVQRLKIQWQEMHSKCIRCSDTFMYLMHISYNNLPNEGSQAGQIISLTESRNKCHPIPLELIKNQRSSYVYTSSRNLLLSDRCDVTFYVNKLLSELIHTDKVSLKVTTFTDNQSLHNTHHSTIQTLVK